VRLHEASPQRQINGEFAMFPYIDPESINAMFPLTADEPALDIVQEASQIPAEYKGQADIVPGRHVAFWTPSRIVATVTTILMICLIIYLIAVCHQNIAGWLSSEVGFSSV
jgi:hypothetical protein